MAFRSRTPLAWKNLTHDRRRLAVAVGGVNFAVVLIFIEMGFLNALFDSTVKMLHDLNADVVLISKANYALLAKQMFPRNRIYQARGCPGVEDVYPVYIETFYAVWKQPGRRSAPIRVLAYEPDDPVFRLPDVRRQSDALRAPGTAIADSKCKATYGIPAAPLELENLKGTELSNRAIRLVGTFDMGTDFANDGNLIMSAANFATYFPNRAPGDDPLAIVDLGIVKVEPGADPKVVAQSLRDMLPNDITALTKEELIRQERRFWATSTPIGFVFTLGMLMGFVVGVIMCYQIIHSDISDHMSEFATLKAMGYGNGYFVRVVLQQSLLLSLLGFVPGWLISFALYRALAASTGLLMDLNWQRTAFVLVVTMLMCSVSGCLAMRKVLTADPGELF